MAKDQFVKLAAVLAALIVVVSAVVLIAAGRLQIGMTVDVDTIGLEQNCGAVTAAIEAPARGFGRFSDPASDLRKRGELFSTTRLWYSWFKDGESRPVVVEALVKDCAQIAAGFAAQTAFYTFDYSENGLTWQPFHQDRIPLARVVTLQGGDLTFTKVPGLFLGSYELIVDGFTFCKVDTTGGCPADQVQSIADGAALRVQSWIQRTSFPAWGPVVIASDQIELRSAVPEVHWDRPGYVVGETATLTFEIPTLSYETCTAPTSPGGDPICKTVPAYFLEILDTNTNAPLQGFDRIPLTKTSGRFFVVILPGMISNDLATCNNRLRASIWTSIIRTDLEETAVRAPDVSITGGDPPSVLSITFDKAEYAEGDTVKMRWATDGIVTKVHVTVHINGLIVYDADVDGSVREVSFRTPAAGIGEAQVTAYNRCTASDIRKEVFTVGNVFPGLCEIFPELPQCVGENLTNLILAALALIGIMLAFFFGIFVASKIQGRKGSGTISLLVGIAAAGIVAVVFLTAGALDALFVQAILEGVNG